jgi:hypothetical protein
LTVGPGHFVHDYLYPHPYSFKNRDATWPYKPVKAGCEQVMQIQKDEANVGTQPILDFQSGDNTTLTVTNDAANNRVKVKIDVDASVTGSGTAGNVPLWDGTNDLTDSLISQAGGGITVSGDLATDGVHAITAGGVVNAVLGFEVNGVAGADASGMGMTFTKGILTAGSPTGAVTIGGSVSGGSAGSILAVGAGPVLAQYDHLRGGTW